MSTESSTSAANSDVAGPLHLRDADVADAEAIEAVHYASREARYQGRTESWPPVGPDRLGRVARWRSWLSDPGIECIVGEVDGEVLGFCTIRASIDGDADSQRVAEMPTLYLRPDSWGRGFGRVLCDAGVDRARAGGFSELTLWVLELNEGARAFYDAVGFSFDGATQVDEATKERLVAQRYRTQLSDSEA
jgi:ribosomal protein S18 acetylase RimI-like enzyme